MELIHDRTKGSQQLSIDRIATDGRLVKPLPIVERIRQDGVAQRLPSVPPVVPQAPLPEEEGPLAFVPEFLQRRRREKHAPPLLAESSASPDGQAPDRQHVSLQTSGAPIREQ